MVSAIVLAAGSGSRMKSKVPKQFLELGGKPLIYYSLARFEASVVDEIILVTRQQDIDYVREENVKKYGFSKVRSIVPGGKERFESVSRGLKAVNRKSDIVMIHDGVRPFVTNSMILDSISNARRYKACTVAVPGKDTIKVVDEDMNGVETPDRSTLYIVQTPQSFNKALLDEAYKRLRVSGDRNITDDTMIVEKYMGQTVKIIEGDYKNIKVTTPEDIPVAEAMMNA